MRSSYLAAALTAATALAASALTVSAQAAPDPATVQAGAYHIEPSHTRVQFAVNHLGLSTYFGDFTGAKGSLTLDPKAPAASKVEVTLPISSVSTTNTVLDGELKGADWFDAAKFPTLSFRSTSVTPTGKDTAKVAGELTLHGVTKPVTLEVRFHGAGNNPLSKAYTVGFDDHGTIKRSEFGVTKYVPLVSDEVEITISAPFEKNPA
jgi:polyisoprenoid-binding protein YceI